MPPPPADRDDGPRVYRYLFTHALENPNPFVGRGAVHTTDLPFIFHTLGMGGLVYTPTAAEQALSTTMATTWTSFREGGQPEQRLHSFLAALRSSDGFLPAVQRCNDSRGRRPHRALRFLGWDRRLTEVTGGGSTESRTTSYAPNVAGITVRVQGGERWNLNSQVR